MEPAAINTFTFTPAPINTFELQGPAQGPPGTDGKLTPIQIGTISFLPAGSTGTVTNTGTATAPIINFGIPLSGGITNNNSYTVDSFSYAQKNLSGTTVDALTGVTDGTNKAFTVPLTRYAAKHIQVFINGVLQVPGDAYVETNPTLGIFTMATAPTATDQMYVIYQKEDVLTEIQGPSNEYIQAYVDTALAAVAASFATDNEVQMAVGDKVTALQMSNAINNALVAYKPADSSKFIGGNANNYVSPTVPTGVLSDWALVSGIYTNANNSVWVKPLSQASTPQTPVVTTPSSNTNELSLAALSFQNMHMNADHLATDHGTPEYTGSGPLGRALTMAVLSRDQSMYDYLLAAADPRFKRTSQTTGPKNCYARAFNITTNTTADWGVSSGDQVTIMGAAIRAWNLWGRAKDRDMASAIAYDIKNFLINTDEGRAYLVADENQKQVVNGHHLATGNPVWDNEIGGIQPVVFRMAKTFTSDTIFDQLLYGFYDALGKVTINSGPLATTTGLPPRHFSYNGTLHSATPIVAGTDGWTTTASTDFDPFTSQIIGHIYEDYKLYGNVDGRALTWLTGNVKTFLTNKYTTTGKIYTRYTRAGAAVGTDESATMYRLAYMVLTANDPNNATAALIKADKIPYPTAVSGDNHYFNDQAKGVTAVSTRDGDNFNWIAQAQVDGLYQDIALYGTSPTAGTTATPANTNTPPVNDPGTPVVTPPASTGTGIAVASWYANGAAPALSQSVRQTIARGEYDKFKAMSFVNYHCNPDGTNKVTLPDGQCRVMIPDETNDDPRKSNSEAAGYGMLATVFYGNPQLPAGIYDSTAQTWFDGFWKYYRTFKGVHGLVNWKMLSNGTVVGTGGATDGDVDMAFALVMAHRMWGSSGAINYGQEATTYINAIRDWEFVPVTGYPNPNYMTNGDLWGLTNTTYFPDYFAPAWFREYYKHTGDSRWLDIINVNYPIAQGLSYNPGAECYNPNGLLTDITRDGKRAGYGGPLFGYNNIRYPFRVSADFLWNGSATNSLAHDAPNRLVARAKVKLGSNPVTPSPTGDGKYDPYSGFSGIVSEPSIDYAYWGGTYRNGAYVQAYGVAGTVDAAHSTWAAQCMQWLQTDNEVNYFGRSLSCMSTMLMAGIMSPATPASTGTTTTTPTTTDPTPVPDPVVVTPPASNAPVGSYQLYALNDLAIHSYIAGLSPGTKKDRLTWVGNTPMPFWSGIEWDPNCDGVKTHVDQAAAQGKVALVVSYSIPGRDLGQYSGGGAGNRAAYEAWIAKMIIAIGNRKVIMEYEPDSLPQSDSLAQDQRTGRYSMMAWAISELKKKCPNLWLYADAGHSAWRSVSDTANLLRQIHIENADGFCVNTSNFRPDAECIAYAQAILANLNMSTLRFVFDSGRNGGTAPNSSQWANPASRQFGRQPQFGNTGIDKCDGWMWWKIVGESDGNNNDSWVGETAPSAGTFYPHYLYVDGVADNYNSGTVAGGAGMAQRPPTQGVSATT